MVKKKTKKKRYKNSLAIAAARNKTVKYISFIIIILLLDKIRLHVKLLCYSKILVNLLITFVICLVFYRSPYILLIY